MQPPTASRTTHDYWDRYARWSGAQQLLATCAGVLETSPACTTWVATMFWSYPPPVVETITINSTYPRPGVVRILRSTINVLSMSARLLWQSFVHFQIFMFPEGSIFFVLCGKKGEYFAETRAFGTCSVSFRRHFICALDLGHHKAGAIHYFFSDREWLHAFFITYSCSFENNPGTIKYGSRKLEN